MTMWLESPADITFLSLLKDPQGKPKLYIPAGVTTLSNVKTYTFRVFLKDDIPEGSRQSEYSIKLTIT